MTNPELCNSIVALAAYIELLNRACEQKAIEIITAKILELVKNIR